MTRYSIWLFTAALTWVGAIPSMVPASALDRQGDGAIQLAQSSRGATAPPEPDRLRSGVSISPDTERSRSGASGPRGGAGNVSISEEDGKVKKSGRGTVAISDENDKKKLKKKKGRKWE